MLAVFLTLSVLLHSTLCSPLLSVRVESSTTREREHKSYIIKFRKDAPYDSTVGRLRTLLNKADDASTFGYLYDPRILAGLSASLSPETLEKVAKVQEIDVIYPDTKMSILPVSVSEDREHDESIQSQSNNKVLVESNVAPWGLQRISQRDELASQDWTPVNFNYSYLQPAGKGVFVYVLDTGIRASHKEFSGRAQLVKQFGGYHLSDGNGHGTHCSGVVGGRTWGAAKSVQIRGVKVLDDEGQGFTSDIIAGIEYVVDQFRASQYKPTVASLSLGGDRNGALDEAVSNAVREGVHFSVSAGNSASDACLSSPAGSGAATTVAATAIDDSLAYYSNYGSCVNILAPGSNITSSWFTSDRSAATISGTSVSAPYVAGIMAYYLSQRNVSTDDMKDWLQNTATSDSIQMEGSDSDNDNGDTILSTPNLLLYNSVY